MVVCAAYGCRSGYNSQKSATDDADETHPKLSYHSFPLQDKDLCEKWVRAIRRQNFVATKYSKLCSLYFKETDFVEVSRDTNKQRRKSGDKQLRKRYLKDGAVLSILPNAPHYLTNTSEVPRTTVRATSSSRLDYEAIILGQMEESFLAEDDISTLSVSEIADRLGKETTLPQGFSIKCIDQALFIYIIEVTDDVPKIKGSVTVKADLSTDFAFMMAVLCWRIWEEVRSTPDMMVVFLASSCQRSLFCKVIDRASYTGNFADQFQGEDACTSGHDMIPFISKRFFNCVAKNFAKELTNTPNQQPRQSGSSSVKKRKLAKLSSEPSHK